MLVQILQRKVTEVQTGMGQGIVTEKFIHTNYAVEIGKVINSNNYNTFSIGYGMDD